MALTADIQQQVFDLLSRASSLSFVSADQEGAGRLGLAPGQRVMAEVLSNLPGQRVQVRIGSERFNLEIPMAVRPGQSLEMTYVSGTPRATFAIARPGTPAPPVSLSDASRLLGLLVGNEQIQDPQVRGSLQSIGELLRRSSGDAGILANLMDEALTYRSDVRPPSPAAPAVPSPDRQGHPAQSVPAAPTAEQLRLTAFEANASQMLQHIARSSRFVLVEAANQPVVPLPLLPGQEVDAAVQGSLPGRRTFVQVAGTSLELILPRQVQEGDILRLTYLSSTPKPLFAVPRNPPAAAPGDLSEAGRWLSVLEHTQGGVSNQQMYVLERLNTVLKSLPPDSPALAAILDEAVTYQSLFGSGRPVGQPAAAAGAADAPVLQTTLQPGNGVILSDEMARLLQALIKGDRLTLLESLRQQPLPQEFSPGQQLKGEVLELLGGQRFLVQVAGQALEFSLPKGITTGALVNLFFITNDPRPTFLLARYGRPGDARLSETGRWLGSLLGAAAERAPAQETLGILRILLSGPPSDGGKVGPMLEQGLRESGLFYESHLARWFGGEYRLEDILREPQGRLSHLNQPVVTQESRPAEIAVTTRQGSLQVLEAALRDSAGRAHEAPVDQRALPVVQEQLQSLQSGHLLFRGELFAGQPLEWSVRERQGRRRGGVRERSWETTLKIDLPRLGLVGATVTLEENGVGIDIRAGQSVAAERLHKALPALAEQLQAAGLAPGRMGVRHEPD